MSHQAPALASGSTEVAPLAPNPYEAYGEAATRSSSFLKFSKGDFLRGSDAEVVEVGTKFVADMPNLQVGYVRWSGGAPTDRILGRVGEGWKAPRRAELGDSDKSNWESDSDGKPRDPWQWTNELPLISKDGSVDIFATSSRGGLNAIGELCKDYGAAMRAKPDKLPVIALGVGSYQHSNREYGRIKYPIFEIVNWVGRDQLPAATASPDDDGAPPAQRAIAAGNGRAAESAPRAERAPPAPQATAPADDDDVPWL